MYYAVWGLIYFGLLTWTVVAIGGIGFLIVWSIITPLLLAFVWYLYQICFTSGYDPSKFEITGYPKTEDQEIEM